MRDLGRSVIGIGTLAACIALGGGVARADVTANFFSSTAVVGGSDWTYQVTLDSIQHVDNTTFPNFVTVYDFGPNTYLPGLTTGSLVNWIGSSNLTDTPAFETTPTDNATLANFRLTAPANTIITAPGVLGTFTLLSPFGPNTVGTRTVSNDGQALQIVQPLGEHGNVGSTIAPVVPAPILGAGLPGLIAACGALVGLARRRRQQVA
jgi:hypothetical protein